MARRVGSVIVVGLALALVAVACGGEREESAPDTTTTSSAGATTTTAPESGTGVTTTTEASSGGPGTAMFGDVPWPCGPGDASTATDLGVTADEIVIGAGDDRGFAGQPGLNKPMTDSLEAMVAACNELGGINGRPVRVIVFDAAISNIINVTLEACEQVFMLVGEGFALDALGEESRIGCGLPAVPGFSVSADFGHGPLVRQPVPNPADYVNLQAPSYLARTFPDAVSRSAALTGNIAPARSTRDKALAAYPSLGYDFVLDLEYEITGEADWAPFVLQMAEADIGFVYYSSTCLPVYQAFRRSAVLNGFEAIYLTEPNMYEASCAAANVDNSMDGTYIRIGYIPFEEADVNPATADYVDLADAAGVEPTLIGVQAASAFLLWATAASACGDDLTRECVLDEIDRIDDWTGHGLHIAADPGGIITSPCGLVLEMRGTEFVRVWPTERGTFECDPSFLAQVDTPWVDAVALDENRVATIHTGG